MEFNIALIKGDGIGSEISDEAVKILKVIEKQSDHKFNFTNVIAAGEAVDKYGEPLPLEALKQCKKSDAILFGNLGGSKWSQNPMDKMPEKALLELRKEIKTSLNIRNIIINNELKHFSPLRPEIIETGIDIVVIRDIACGMLIGDKKTGVGLYGREASDLEFCNEELIRCVAEYGFKLARARNKKLASLDKANVLATSKLWREIVTEVAENYGDVEVEHILIDNAAMEVLIRPSEFDVIITSNIFGDIISDQLSQITGAASMLSSIELSDTGKGIYTPNQLHYPDESIIGLNKANPIGLIRSAAMMLRYSFGLEREAKIIEDSINEVIFQGYATEDIYSEGKIKVTTREMGDLVRKQIENSLIIK